MNLHEYQAKDVFRSYGIPVPAGKVAASAGVNLRLDRPDRAAERAGGGGGFLGACSYLAGRHRDSVAAEQLLGLIFVEIHRRAARCA